MKNISATSDCFILGDSGYGILPWLMVPYKKQGSRQLPLDEKHFNNLFVKERVIIERCFGQMKKRFPILGNCMRLHTMNVPKMIVCGAVLHNIGKYLGDVLEQDLNDEDIEEEEHEENEQHSDAELKRRGEEKRNSLKNSL